MRHNITSNCDNVKIEIDPNNVLHTSPDKLADVENKLTSK